MSSAPEQERAARLVFERWNEQLDTSFLPRRARTLGVCGALAELAALAEGWVRSGGQMRPAVDPDDGGHGVAMLPDVAAEAEGAVRDDVVLRNRYPERRDVLAEAAKRLKSEKPDDTSVRESLGRVNALLRGLRQLYVATCFEELDRLIADKPGGTDDIVSLVESAVSELRAIGWTDVGLREAAVGALAGGPATASAVNSLRDTVMRQAADFTCFVSLTLPEKRPPFPTDDATFAIVDALPDEPRVGRSLKRGSYVRVVVKACDATGAALVAYRRVLSTLGALTVSLPASRIDVSSDVVGVLSDGGLRGCEVQERLVEEKRTAKPEEVVRIIASSWRASATPAADPLHDAIRLRHRALVASDAESRLLLLWSGLERLTSGARGFRAALSAAKELVSDAVTFGKLRRDVGDLAATIEHAVTDEEKRRALLALVGGYGGPRVNREAVLDHLLSDENKLRQLLGLFYDEQPLLVHRCYRLWKDFGAGNAERRGKSIAAYHERSRERVGWQVGRIYRARNRIAHVGVGPERVRDLVGHAHFYLTQLIAICVHYGEKSEARSQDMLVRRMGQYQTFVQLLTKGDAACLTPKALMRPSSLVGGDD